MTTASRFLPALILSAFAAAAPDPDSHWSPAFGLGTLEFNTGALSGTANEVEVDSQHVYFGGSFHKVSGMRVNNIVRYHKQTGRFERLGSANACGVNGQVLVIKLVPGGVHVGGRFTHAGVDSLGQGGVETGPYAVWDGKEWKGVGAKLTIQGGNAVVSQIVFGTGVTYLAGAFSMAGSDTIRNIAAYKGGDRYEALYDQGRLTNGLAGSVVTIAGFKVTGLEINTSHVVAGGNFNIAGGRTTNGTARWQWTLEEWDGMKGGLSHAPASHVNDMDQDDFGRIYFAYRGLHYFDDTGWVAVKGTETSSISRVLMKTPFGSMIYGSGGPAFDSGQMSFLVGNDQWKAVNLSKLGYLASSSDVGFAADDKKLWIASGGGVQGALGMTWYDGKQLGPLGNGLRNTRAGGLGINAFAELEGKVIAAGSFSHLGATAVEGIARWNGEAWEALGEGYSSVYRTAVYQGKLYAAGTLNKPGQPTAGGLAVWTGTAWEIVPGFEKRTSITALAATDKYLWMASDNFVDGNTRAPLGRWDGDTLVLFGSELRSTAQIGIDDIVPRGEEGACVSGYFNRVGTAAAGGAACFDGKAWTPLGGALTTGNTTSMAAIGNALFLGCACTFPGGAKNLARWDGNAWVSVGADPDNMVLDLRANGSDLYVVGRFVKAGAATLNGVGRWNGDDWAALGSGLSFGGANVAWVGPGGLWLGGGFTTAGGIPSRNIALYGGIVKQADVPMGIARHARPAAGRKLPAMRPGREGMEFGLEGKPRRADGKSLRETRPVKAE